MDATHNHQGILSSPLSHGKEEEERMIERVHGIDRHKQLFARIGLSPRPKSFDPRAVHAHRVGSLALSVNALTYSQKPPFIALTF
jgi:hypothetical protein